MALVLKDRVKETSATAGTGALTLGGTSTGYQAFSVIGNGNTTYYTIYDSTTGAWEVGTGTYTSSTNSLSRNSVFSSSNGGSLVDFAANTKDVFVAYPAEEAVTLDSAQTVSNKTLSGANLGTPTAGVLTNATGLPLTTGVTGVLLEANGGTGESTYTNGQLLIGNAAGGLTKATLTAGTGVTITNGDGTITINAPEVGTVTSVTASAPLASSGGNTPNISFTGTLGVANGGTGRSVGNYSVYANEIHVSNLSGNDTTGDGTLINPVATVTKALTLLTAVSRTVILHPGVYAESPTVNATNTTITTLELTGANTNLTGTLTLSAAARVSGLKMNNLTITGTGSAYISNCTVDTQVIKSGSNYVEIINSELQCVSGVQITGAGTVSIVGNKCWSVAISNASANVLIKDCFQVLVPSVTAGTLNIDGCAVFAAAPTSNAITTSAGSFITLANSFVLNSAGTNVERVSLSGSYSILNLVYDKTNSTFAGTNLNAIDYFSVINADTLVLTNDLTVVNGGTGASTFTSNGVLLGNGTSALTATAVGTTGQVLVGNTGAAPSWGTLSSSAVTSFSAGTTGLTPSTGTTGAITLAGTLGVANGGTNSTATPTAGGVAYGTGTAYAVSTAGTAGQYLQSTGSGAPAWSSISSGVGSTAYYGAFQDTTDQTIASTTTAYIVNIGTVNEANGVTIVSGTRITYANAGTYALTYSIQLENANSSIHEADIWVRKNGTDLADTNSQFSVANKHGSTNGHLIAVCNYVFTLAAGDYLELAWAATTTDISIQTYPAQTSPTRPLTPGVIVTTAQLTQIGIGYYGLTSTSSVAIGTGTKTFTTNLNSTNTAFTVGSRVRVAYPPDPTYFMEGNITAFSGTTLTINADVVGGSGTLANWSFTSVGSAGVTSISGGTTGLTPSTATTGAVTLAGTLATTNGGTGLTSFTSGGAVYASSTSALTTGTLPIASGGTGATDAATARANLGAGTGNGTVTSVNGTGTVNGITLTGTVTSSGSLTLGGTLSGVSLTTQVSGTLPVANGGTGLTAGTSGGVLYYSATGTLASSAALASNALVVGGGAGVAPSTITTGTGVVTALGVNTGSSGAFTTNNSANTFTAAQTFRAASAIRSEAASTQDAIVIAGRAGGTSSYASTITPATLSANRTVTIPDETFTVGFRNIPAVGTKTASYTLTTSDVGKYVQVGTSGSIVVPNSTFAEGDVITVFNNTTGNITITTNPTSSYIAGTNTTKASMTLATRGVATILFISSTVCVVTGNVT